MKTMLVQSKHHFRNFSSSDVKFKIPFLHLFGNTLPTERTKAQHTYGPCALAADSLGRSVGRMSRRTISAAPACGCHRTQASVWICPLFLRIVTSQKIKKQICYVNITSHTKTKTIPAIDIYCTLSSYYINNSHYSRVNKHLSYNLYFTTWRHLFLLAYGVIPGKLDPLVGFDTRYTQELNTLHAVTRRLCVVITAHAHL